MFYPSTLSAPSFGLSQTITSGYHGAIAACAECGHWEGATSLLQRMRQDPLVVVTAKEVKHPINTTVRYDTTKLAGYLENPITKAVSYENKTVC